MHELEKNCYIFKKRKEKEKNSQRCEKNCLLDKRYKNDKEAHKEIRFRLKLIYKLEK